MTTFCKQKNNQNVNEIVFEINSVLQTHELAAFVADNLQKGCFIGLYGQLGAGKSEFVRGLAAHLGIRGAVRSPTFVLQLNYDIGHDESAEGSASELNELCHWDLYRLAGKDLPGELHEQYGNEKKIVCIEWPDKIAGVEDLLALKIKFSDDLETSRDLAKNSVVNFQDSGKRLVTFWDVKDTSLYKALSLHG